MRLRVRKSTAAIVLALMTGASTSHIRPESCITRRSARRIGPNARCQFCCSSSVFRLPSASNCAACDFPNTSGGEEDLYRSCRHKGFAPVAQRHQYKERKARRWSLSGFDISSGGRQPSDDSSGRLCAGRSRPG